MADAAPKNPDAIPAVSNPVASWLSRQAPEEILEPDLPIVDPHHHLWNRGGHRYLLDELLADTESGHRVQATVFIECMAYYTGDASRTMKPVGETEFVNGVAAMAHSVQARQEAEAAGRADGPMRACAGIVGFADLTLGAAVQEVLDAHARCGNGRFRGIRHAGSWDASPDIHNSHTRPTQHLYGEKAFREGFARLAPSGLSFEAWQFHPQLPDVIDLARAFPDTSIILDHCGGPLGVGPYAGRQDETFAQWQRGIRELAQCPNVTVKLGGLGMKIGVFDFPRRDAPPGSAELAQAFRPWIETCIEAFGPERCMFESNFPVDMVTSTYAVLWNAFKRLAAGSSEAEKTALFSGTARRVYRLD
jgi:predicted TIM-barrel fold metal-dependent hydrolase